MLIDWFTVTAQIVNFLILVALLKRFFYGRIIDAMDRREKAISSRLEEAEQKLDEAARQHKEYAEKNRGLDEDREKIMASARQKADELQEELKKKARAEIDSLRHRLHDSLRQDKETFLRDLRAKTAEQVCAVTRRALNDMASADLEEKIMSNFIDKIESADDVRETFSRALARPDTVLSVSSAFELAPDSRKQIEKTCREVFDLQRPLQYSISESLLAGIRLAADGATIEFSFSGYMDELSEEIRSAVEEEAPEKTNSADEEENEGT